MRNFKLKNLKLTSSDVDGCFERDPDFDNDPTRKALRDGFIEAAESRIRNDPDTRAAVDRLMASGVSEFDAKGFIANLVAREVWYAMHEKVTVERSVYLDWLRRLPDLDDD